MYELRKVFSKLNKRVLRFVTVIPLDTNHNIM